MVVRGFVDDFAAVLNRSKVYLYDSAEYWALQGVSEGFGLQPLEALACGCQVFSSVNGGLSDYLDPGFNSYKIAGYSVQYDLQRILKVVQTGTSSPDMEALLAEYRQKNIIQRLNVILKDINDFFDAVNDNYQPIPTLTRTRLLRMKGQILIQKGLKVLLKR